MKTDAAFLKLALGLHRERMLEELKRVSFAASAHLEVDVVGVPGVERVALFAWPEPLGPARRIAVDVVRLDRTTLRTPVCFSFELEAGERPVVEEMPPIEVGVEDGLAFPDSGADVLVGPVGRRVLWKKIAAEAAGVEREVLRLERDGSPVFGRVDTREYSYRMTCTCGRVRYSKPNSLHQIGACRVCTRGDRLRKRALSQYRSRHGKKRKRS